MAVFFKSLATGEVKTEGMEVIEPSTNKAILWVIAGLLFNIIGAIALIIVGYNKLRHKHEIKAWQYQSQAVYVADRRCKTGMRYDGDYLTKRKVIIEANEYETELNKKIAKIYLWAGFIMIVLFVTITIASNGLS